MNMNKGELIDQVAKKAGLSNAEAARALNAVLDTITDTLKKNGAVTLPGFGSFTVKSRASRNGVNPATGERIEIGAKKAPCFKPGSRLKDALS